MRHVREYVRPPSPEEALDIKRQHGERAAYLAGGSDLLVHKDPRIEVMIDIRHAGIGYVRQEDGEYVIGGAALLRDAEEAVASVAGGMLREAMRDTAPWLIRNAATVAGNIANASPAADSVPALIALDVQLVLLDGGRERVDLLDVLVGPHQTALNNRLIAEIRVPAAAGSRSAHFIKLARSKSDIALVNVAVSFSRDEHVLRDVRIALGAVAPTAMRAREAESALEGQAATRDRLKEVEQLVRGEVRPISDWRASEEYRRRMSGVLVRRAIETALGRETTEGA